MGDGPQVRQQLDDVQRVSTTRAWRPAAAGRDWGAGCSVLFALALVVCCYMHLGFVPNEAEQQQQQVPVDAMGDESQVPSKATRHSTAQICHALSRAWCCPVSYTHLTLPTKA